MQHGFTFFFAVNGIIIDVAAGTMFASLIFGSLYMTTNSYVVNELGFMYGVPIGIGLMFVSGTCQYYTHKYWQGSFLTLNILVSQYPKYGSNHIVHHG